MSEDTLGVDRFRGWTSEQLVQAILELEKRSGEQAKPVMKKPNTKHLVIDADVLYHVRKRLTTLEEMLDSPLARQDSSWQNALDVRRTVLRELLKSYEEIVKSDPADENAVVQRLAMLERRDANLRNRKRARSAAKTDSDE